MVSPSRGSLKAIFFMVVFFLRWQPPSSLDLSRKQEGDSKELRSPLFSPLLPRRGSIEVFFLSESPPPQKFLHNGIPFLATWDSIWPSTALGHSLALSLFFPLRLDSSVLIPSRGLLRGPTRMNDSSLPGIRFPIEGPGNCFTSRS